MGRFEKRSENSRTGDPFTEADTALRAVTEELQIIQRTLLKSLQEDIKCLQTERLRLVDDVKRLQEEKEELLQGRQLSELQVLLRQLANILASHISSQLQSSLETLAKQAVESTTEDSEESNAVANQLLGSLDDTLTITFHTLQQEVKNYQTNISQQLSQMSLQQQQGEEILAELVNRLRGELVRVELEKTTQRSPQQSPPTVIQTTPHPADEPTEQQYSSFWETPPHHKEEPTQQQYPSFGETPLHYVDEPTEQQYSSFWETPPNHQEEPTQQQHPAEESTQQQYSSFWETPPHHQEEPTQQQHPAEEPTQQHSSFWETPPHHQEEPTQQEESSDWDVETELETNRIREYGEAQIDLPEESEVFAFTNDDVVSANSFLEGDTTFISNGVSPREEVTTSARSQRKNSAIAPMGLLFILLSTGVISLYNVAIKVIFNPNSLIFGAFEVEGLLTPTLGNSLLILMLRMLVVVPLMLVLAPILYPQVWQDLQNLVESLRTKSRTANAKSKQVLLLSIVSGCFLFLSQVLIYIAISQITTGIAIALLFIYPAISALLAWSLLREQPTSFRFGAIASIFVGQMMILAGDTGVGTGNAFVGSIAALVSGIAFAFYIILTRVCASKLHPVPFTLINFATMLVLSLVGLILPLPITWSLQVNPNKLLELILSAFILGVLTLFGYVFNNVGVRKLGATRSAILGATVPVLTVILTGVIIQETLQPAQVLGVLLVTFGAAAISYEKIRNHTKTTGTTSRN
ncbi:EamA family transporter [Pelatocladus sp. BLCC-F211]|uniref:EamA family transporter n=1 Tax=Pelatocladus sp. BLCC-F211 TaxID=3342752 RepID=UPI0035BACF55